MLSYVAGTVGRLEESVERGFREVREVLSRMPNDYVPRRELDKRFDDVTFDVAELRRAREQDQRDKAAAEIQAERDRQARLEQAARDRRTDRWQRIALAVSSSLALTGTGVGVVLHFH
jgi:membrane-bound lytic murein transglycosylase B